MGSVFPHFKIIFSLITEPLFFTPTWPTTKKGLLYQKLSYIYLKNRIFQPKTFLTLVWKNRSPGTLTSSNQKRNFYPKNFIWLPKKNNISNKKFFTPAWKSRISSQRRKSLYFLQKNSYFSSEKKKFSKQKQILLITGKKFSALIISSVFLKNIFFHTFGRNSKPFISDVFWIRLCYFFMLAN